MTSSFGAFEDYISLEKNYSRHTASAYLNDLISFQGFLQNTYEIEDLAEVVYPMIRSWIVVLVEQGLTNRTVNRKCPHLNLILNFC